ncbi:MAG TPA: hypothetical protein DCQ98_09910 [Planctomycetaceae bacterium]|nr:hypothetical protein [Planctomycetaceae bacterium]
MIDVTTERLITLKQAAELLQVQVRTIRRHIGQGLEVSRIGGRLYTSREAIHRFSQPVGPPTANREPPALSRRHTAILKALRERHGIDLRKSVAG